MNGIVLASSSPRRAAILRQAQIPFSIRPVSSKEICVEDDPIRTVMENARIKAEACRLLEPDQPVLAADTVVSFRGRVLGKPRNKEEAFSFLRRFSGEMQMVFTGVAFSLPGQEMDLRVEASSVRFRTLTDALIKSYLETTEPYDRAGAYDINDHGDWILSAYFGSYTNIMGLPIRPVLDWYHAQVNRESLL